MCVSVLGARCSLFGVVCLLCIFRRFMCADCFLFDVCWSLLFVVCCLLRIACWCLFVCWVCFFLVVGCLQLLMRCWLFFGDCYFLGVMCLLCVVCVVVVSCVIVVVCCVLSCLLLFGCLVLVVGGCVLRVCFVLYVGCRAMCLV